MFAPFNAAQQLSFMGQRPKQSFQLFSALSFENIDRLTEDQSQFVPDSALATVSASSSSSFSSMFSPFNAAQQPSLMSNGPNPTLQPIEECAPKPLVRKGSDHTFACLPDQQSGCSSPVRAQCIVLNFSTLLTCMFHRPGDIHAGNKLLD